MPWQSEGDRALSIDIDPRDPRDVAPFLAVRGVTDVTRAFSTIIVHYDPISIASVGALQRDLSAAMQLFMSIPNVEPTTHEIPVRYGGECGPDLEELAERGDLSVRDFVDLHTAGDYAVAAVGFMPGFGYLTGLPARLHAPRRATPRTRVPAGSLGIGAAYTGVYPRASPGGWNLIGRTPIVLFDPSNAASPARLRVGDRVRFRPISPTEMRRWK